MEIPSGFSYAFPKLAAAIEELVGAGDIKERLLAATMAAAPAMPEDFPEPLRTEFASIREALTWLPGGEDPRGMVGATIEAMAEDEADAIARRLLSLYEDAAEFYYVRFGSL